MNIHDRATIEIRGKKIVILGLALSGAAASKLAVRQGADVFVSDNQDTLALQGTLKNHGTVIKRITKLNKYSLIRNILSIY